MTEYEEVRERYERSALESHSMGREAIDFARDVGVRVLCALGLTQERVWALTRNMRRLGNGGTL